MEEFTPVTPTPMRPLLGMTILAVEDSRYACDALRLLSLRSGARLRRADCIASAHRHLQVYRPTIILVDIGLPDGSGVDLIKELTELSHNVGTIIGISGDDNRREEALAAGAHGFMAKPINNITRFQDIILASLPKEVRPSGPRIVQTDDIEPDPLTFKDDLAHAADLLDLPDADNNMLSYLAQFVTGLANSAGDRDLAQAGKALAEATKTASSVSPRKAQLSQLVSARLEERIAI